MPSIDVAMARSLRGGVAGILGRSLQKAFAERSIVSDAETNISDVKTAFSSWDNCMNAVYCKWPVIAVIIIGGLILFSVIWCISRCLCCGLSCCCECCHCLKCCGNCCGCCDPPNGGRRRKYLDEPYKNLPSEQGYQRQDPMSTGALPFNRPAPTAKAEPPQYASFDVSKKAEGDDDLPAMPTWGDAESKKVGLAEEAVELQQLKPEANGQNAPLMNGMSPAATPGTMTPVQGGVSPYGPLGSQAAPSGYMGAGGFAGADPYNNNTNNNNHMPGQGYNQMHKGYGQSTTSFHTEQSWGVTGVAPGQDYGQGRPHMGYGQDSYTREPVDMQYNEHGGYGEYGNHDAVNQGYGMGPARSMTGGSNPSMMPARSMTGGSNPSIVGAAAYPDRSHGSPAPQQAQLAHQRQFDPRIAPQRTYSPAPQQQDQFPNGPQRTFSPAPPQRSFSPAPGGPQRTYSPAPGSRGGPGPQRQWSGDTAPGLQGGPPRTFSAAPGPRSSPGPHQRPRPPADAGLPLRGPPYRQYSADSAQTAPAPQRKFSSDSPRPRLPPQRQYTADAPPGPRSPNFSRPTRSNTFDQDYGARNDAGMNQQEPSGAYPGYKPYQPAR